jgi:exodeoxyribonuclease VII small subunit
VAAGSKTTENGENGADGLTFEQALAQLDETVGALEAGDLPLAEATGLYERGMKLARVCSEMLAAAELKITRIQTAYGEQMRLPAEDRPEGAP